VSLRYTLVRDLIALWVSLVQKIKEVMGSLNKVNVARPCKLFQSRIKAMVEADGDFIK
jgi:hypothetical protein